MILLLNYTASFLHKIVKFCSVKWKEISLSLEKNREIKLIFREKSASRNFYN